MHSHDRTLVASLGFADPDKKDSRHDLACQYLSCPDVALRILAPFLSNAMKVYPKHEEDEVVSNKKDVRTRDESLAASGVAVESVANEIHLCKGEGQYRSTIGFVDVVIRGYFSTCVVTRTPHWSYVPNPDYEAAAAAIEADADREFAPKPSVRYWDTPRYDYVQKRASRELYGIQDKVMVRTVDESTRFVRHYKIIAVEVKAQPTGIGDVLRQINLYREYQGSLLDNSSRGYVHPPVSWVVATMFSLPSIDVDALKRANVRHVQLGPQFEEWCAEQERARADIGPSEDSLIL